MLCITNFLASMMAGVAIFSVLGNMAYEVGVNVRDVAQGGPGLAFIVYPRALSNLPMPTLWYILFFGMILLLGVSSQNAEVESMVTMLVDLKPRFFNANRRRRPLFVLFVCLTCFCCALIMTSQGGMYLFQEKSKTIICKKIFSSCIFQLELNFS
jgi:SNF family Na+-dependent transporter